ncbi:hypothetical protein [Pseudoclavibacter helvolus]|uniref:hypothetical protein n=1 Tax=Pseudoclavibacter helvolus TaxID=255205 RepID=UPI003C7868E1
MEKLLLNTYMWVAIAFFVVALMDFGNDGSVWIVWFILGLVFAIIAYRRPRTNPEPNSQNTTDDGETP